MKTKSEGIIFVIESFLERSTCCLRPYINR